MQPSGRRTPSLLSPLPNPCTMSESMPQSKKAMVGRAGHKAGSEVNAESNLGGNRVWGRREFPTQVVASYHGIGDESGA